MPDAPLPTGATPLAPGPGDRVPRGRRPRKGGEPVPPQAAGPGNRAGDDLAPRVCPRRRQRRARGRRAVGLGLRLSVRDDGQRRQ